jgi:OOP family OmpA-OmpF porin
MLRRKALIAGIFLLAGLLAVAAATAGALRIEAASARVVAQALAEAGHGWAQVATDGLHVRISGTAPDEAARFAALSEAGGLVAPGRIRDATDVLPPASIPPPQFAVEILRGDDRISLIGLVPGEAARARLVAAVERIANGAPVVDLLDSAQYPAPEAWDAAAGYAAAVLPDLPRAKLSVVPGRVRITAVAADETTKRRLATRLVRAAPEELSVALDLRAPRPVVAPYSLRFVFDAGGARFDSCTADSEAARNRIVAAATAAGVDEKIDCRLGLGAPSPEWGRAAAAAIGTVAGLGGGSVTFADGDVALVSAAGADADAFAAAVARLRQTLPPGFSLTAQSPPERPAADAPEFMATRGPEGLVLLRGVLPDAGMRATVEALAEARFDRSELHMSLEEADGLPPGWSLRVVAGIEALARLETGSLRVELGTLTLRGTTGETTLRAELTGLLTDRLGEDAAIDLDIRYEERLDPQEVLPLPEDCVAQIDAVLAERQITFDPGSPTIDIGADIVIGRIADILTDCEPVEMRIEVAGHTDAQGREEMNLALSQSRAEAVIDALMRRGAPISELVARGYGEVQPIADNGTEAGREANRRIEFRLLSEDDNTEARPASATDGAPEAAATDGPAVPADTGSPADGTAAPMGDGQEASDGSN